MPAKVLVSIEVPAANRRYDALVTYHTPLHVVRRLASACVDADAGAAFSSDSDAVLCDGVTGGMFNLSATLEDAGITNGSKLLLI